MIQDSKGKGMRSNLYEVRQYLEKQGIFFAMNGPISQDVMVEIADTLRQKMRLEEAGSTTILRVFSTLVEQAQNIIYYSAETLPRDDFQECKEGIRLGTIAVGYEDDHYFVLTGNLIERAQVEGLRQKLTVLQKMDKEELKKYYKEQRRKEGETDSRGAGLGFIEMAKKSGKPIEFDFMEIDENLLFFSVKTVI